MQRERRASRRVASVGRMMVDTRGTVERWLAGDAERPSDEDIKQAITHMADVAMMGVNGLARLSMQFEALLNATDNEWSLKPHPQGVIAGKAIAYQRAQQASAHLHNAIHARMLLPFSPKPQDKP
jgi:hypothetical protein